jgi:hypothetical protein
MTQNQTKPKSNTRLKAAIGYLKRGWPIVAVAPRAKRPIVKWEPFQHQLPTEEQVRGWFTRWPDANLSVVTGEVSGLVVLDVDPRHGGEESLAGLESRHGKLPQTIESATGGGGRHLYFAHPGHEVRNRVGIMPGIDLRGDGGTIVLPPSVHPSGKQYRWKRGHAPGDMPLASLPVWLEVPRVAADGPQGHPVAYWRALARKGVKLGERNSTIASFAGHLFWHGVDPDVVLELMLAWNRVRCDPLLSDDEVIDTVHSIEKTHARHKKPLSKAKE